MEELMDEQNQSRDELAGELILGGQERRTKI